MNLKKMIKKIDEWGKQCPSYEILYILDKLVVIVLYLIGVILLANFIGIYDLDKYQAARLSFVLLVMCFFSKLNRIEKKIDEVRDMVRENDH
ncbi:hypothetical protein B0186_04870 [Canicola haemoglobinophilus]|uniref:Uncharacterized protein n=1 Tax=Canicola haemoglobinophilus TaxID=733 RepID=A0A1V4B1M5_9PAST|nr:hypothetical protein [Canicola haemoglobinophilus]OOS01073.1 hypothetical protein B0186_04870 [Canicola haemoglobinophilus]STO60312.1 Uncharacterised protein [Canicola haemoglobinophilus]